MDVSTDSKFRNEARRAPLSGRPCLRQYHTEADTGELLDKKTFQRMYEDKWGGAPWLDEEAGENSEKIIILDQVPASSPSASVPTSASNSATSSRRTTLEDE